MCITAGSCHDDYSRAATGDLQMYWTDEGKGYAAGGVRVKNGGGPLVAMVIILGKSSINDRWQAEGA